MAAGGAAMVKVQLSPSTQLVLRRGDLTTFTGDAIVNAANERCVASLLVVACQ